MVKFALEILFQIQIQYYPVLEGTYEDNLGYFPVFEGRAETGGYVSKDWRIRTYIETGG